MKTLNNGYLMTYYEDTATLAKTLVVKHDDIALLMNEGIASNYGETAVDVYRKETWKYYMNVAGLYHPTDTIMTVMSIDTLQEIDFTVENLSIHSATRKAYQYGSRYYFALLDRYPTQEFLINGILNPADIDTAVSALDGSILSYRKDLVEPNEHSLISELEEWFKIQIDRWYNTQFNVSNDIYAAVFFALVQNKALNKIFNLRLKRCHTYEAHSFHVRMFLASHGELDRYLPYLTLKQSLWLYRNIRYLERHPGMLFQFYRLIEHLLTERGIPIAEYNIHQQDSFTNYLPDTTGKSNPLNGIKNQLIDDRQPVSYLFSKETSDAPGNETYLKYSQATEEARFNVSPSAVTGTKLLHSTMTDLTNAVPETYEEIALRQWCKMSCSDQYPCYVNFKDPKSSVTYTLTTKDAFIYMAVINLQHDGLTLSTVPEYLNMRQRKHPKPTVADLLSVVDHKSRDLTLYANALIAAQPVIEPCFSVETFHALIENLYAECFHHWFIISSVEDLYERGLVENMVHQLYEDELVKFSDAPQSLASWLAANNLPAYDYTHAEAELLIKAIFEAGSGIKIAETKMLKNVQRALIELLKELSSYTLQFIREINEDDLILINWPAVRLGNQKVHQSVTRVVETETIVMEATGSTSASEFAGSSPHNPAYTDADLASHPIEVPADTSMLHIATITTEICATDLDSMTVVNGSYAGQDEAYENKTGVLGSTIFRDLPEPIKQKYMKTFAMI